MTILRKFSKQPIEDEVYSIQFVNDIEPSDNLMSTFTLFSRISANAWDQQEQSAPYTTTALDDGRILVTTTSVTGFASAAEGYVLYVSNKSQNSAITVCGFTVPARGCIVVRRAGSAWTIEARTTCVMVDSLGDQRVRTFVSGGIERLTYKAQVAVVTNEGRTLQDEFTVTIKEA